MAAVVGPLLHAYPAKAITSSSHRSATRVEGLVPRPHGLHTTRSSTTGGDNRSVGAVTRSALAFTVEFNRW